MCVWGGGGCCCFYRSFVFFLCFRERWGFFSVDIFSLNATPDWERTVIWADGERRQMAAESSASTRSVTWKPEFLFKKRLVISCAGLFHFFFVLLFRKMINATRGDNQQFECRYHFSFVRYSLFLLFFSSRLALSRIRSSLLLFAASSAPTVCDFRNDSILRNDHLCLFVAFSRGTWRESERERALVPYSGACKARMRRANNNGDDDYHCGSGDDKTRLCGLKKQKTQAEGRMSMAEPDPLASVKKKRRNECSKKSGRSISRDLQPEEISDICARLRVEKSPQPDAPSKSIRHLPSLSLSFSFPFCPLFLFVILSFSLAVRWSAGGLYVIERNKTNSVRGKKEKETRKDHIDLEFGSGWYMTPSCVIFCFSSFFLCAFFPS